MHEAITITLPVVSAILIAALFNRHDVKELRSEMIRRFDILRYAAEIDRLTAKE